MSISNMIQILAVVSCVFGCGNAGHFEPAPLDGLVQKTFHADGHTLSAWVPDAARIREYGPNGQRTTIYYRWGHRNEHPLLLASPIQSQTFDRTVRLKNGAVLEYRIIPPILPPGMGGPEASLIGCLDFGSFSLFVACSDQQSWGDPDPTWCIPFMHYINPVVGPQPEQ